jgi:Zn-dependent peptidase ImmA (M78 family)
VTPRRPERRANAFAAELLLPGEAAADVVRKKSTPDQALEALKWRYQVSRQVAAWQILNRSSQELSEQDRFWLETQAKMSGE